MNKDLESLFNLIMKNSVRFGSFVLASGRQSDLLIDLSTTLRTKEGQVLLGKCASKVLPSDILIGGPLTGSDIVCSSLSLAGVCHRWFGVRKEPKNRGLDVECLEGNVPKAAEHIWIVEDVCTTGGSLKRAVEHIKNTGAIIDGIFAVVDRGGLKHLAAELGVLSVSLFCEEDFRRGKLENNTKESKDIEFTIKCKMRERWVPHFLAMLKYMQQLGGLGGSRKITFYSDGDGDFRPKFEWDNSLPSEAKPVEDENGNRLYDAG